MKKNKIKRLITTALLFALIVALFAPVSAVELEKDREAIVLYENFDHLSGEAGFSTDVREYVSQISFSAGNMQACGKAMRVNSCDFRTWHTYFSENYFYFEIVVMLDSG